VVAGVLVAGGRRRRRRRRRSRGFCRWDFVVKNMMMSTNSLLSF
jgi:hypothetical protein